MAQISKLELDHAFVKVVFSNFCNQRLSFQHDFNMLDGKINDLNTDAKSSRVERLEILIKIEDAVTNHHPDAMRHLIKESIDIEMQKQDPIRYSATVTIKLVEDEIYALKSRFNTFDMKVEANLCESFSYTARTSLQHLQFKITDPCGYFPKF